MEVVGCVVVEEITAPLAFVTVIVTAPSDATVSVVVLPDEDTVAEDDVADDKEDNADAVDDGLGLVSVLKLVSAAETLPIALMLMALSPVHHEYGFRTTPLAIA